MLLQRLVADAGVIIKDPLPEMYVRKPVKWYIDLDESGELIGFLPLTGTGDTKDRGKPIPVPDRVRSGAAPLPFMFADNTKFSLGFLPDGASASDCEKTRKRHASFVSAHVELAQKFLDVKEAQAVARFLVAWQDDPDTSQLPADMRPDDIAVIRVNKSIVVEDARFQEYWAKNWESFGAKGNSGDGLRRVGRCLICGEEAPLPQYIPVKVKGLRGGQSSGTAIVSVNEEAYESYGLRRGHSSPICSSCGCTFVYALNALIAGEDNHLSVGPATFVFWSSNEEADVGIMGLSLLEPGSERVRAHFESYRSGKRVSGDMSAFFVAALSGASGRAVVRDWLDTTMAEATENLENWFGLIGMVDSYGEKTAPLTLYQVAAAPFRDARKEMHATVPQALVRCALWGARLPDSLLRQAVMRSRIGTKTNSGREHVTQARAALIRAVLAQKNTWEGGHMSRLEAGESNPAYLCGRLLAVIEQVQRTAQGNVNTTVVDRFYSSASSAPATVFGRLLADAQAHLKKLRITKGGAAQALQQQLEEVMAGLNGFPKTLRLDEQAMFSLGYYHQRAADRAAAREHKAAKDSVAIQKEETE